MGTLANTRPETSGRTYTCKVGLILANADEEDRAAVNEEMVNDDLSNYAISKWIGVAENTVRKHRARDCVCFRG